MTTGDGASAGPAVRFPAAWCATDLGPFRPCRFTYERYPCETLPPLDNEQFTGSYQWLGDPGALIPERQATVGAVVAALSGVGLSLPQDFITFHTRQGFGQVFDEVSVTGCWTDISMPLASPVEPGAYFVRFLRDQQDSALWYLCLRPSGEVFVAHSYYLAYHLDYPAEDVEWDAAEVPPDVKAADLTDEIFWCASSFEEFAYRFWLENRLWYSVRDAGHEHDVASRRYLNHYRRQLDVASL